MIQPVLTIVDARPAPQSASPAIVFQVRIDVGDAHVHAMVLRCQVQLDARRRRYEEDEQDRLYELFGASSQFRRMLKPVTWARCALVVPTFHGEVICDLDVPCTYDLEVGSAKYLHAIRDGDVPVEFLFTGTIFRAMDGRARIEPIPWDVEAPYRMPAHVWHDTMRRHFAGAGWIRLGRDTIDRLQAFRGRNASITWDSAIETLLERAGEDRPV